MKLISIFTILLSFNLFAETQPEKLGKLIGQCKDIKGTQVDFLFVNDHNNHGQAMNITNVYGKTKSIVKIDHGYFLSLSNISQAFVLENLCAQHSLGHIFYQFAIEPKLILAAECFAIKTLVDNKIITKKENLNEIDTLLSQSNYEIRSLHLKGYPSIEERIDNINRCAFLK